MNSEPSPGDKLPRLLKWIQDELKRTKVRITALTRRVAILEAGGGGGGGVASVVEGDNIDVDSSDPAHPIVSLAGEPVAAAHVADATDAHDASAISIADAGAHFASTDVEGALAELAPRGTFKETVYVGTSEPSRGANSYADVDAALFPPLELPLVAGQVVECLLRATFSCSASGVVSLFDWLIEQPVSADTTIRANGSKKCAWLHEWAGSQTDCITLPATGTFTATEDGLHTFKPQWRQSSGTITMQTSDANYDSGALHRVTILGTPA